MEKKLYIANWKSHKTVSEALEFLIAFQEKLSSVSLENKEIIICPPFTALSACSAFIKEHNLSISLGSQNVSKFPEGAYTGEVAAKHIKEFAEYVIIGHSERRSNFLETDDDVQKKVDLAKLEGLKTIVCIPDENGIIPKNADIIAYEPPSRIGTGIPDTPENITRTFLELNKKSGRNSFIYGASVDAKDIDSFLKIPYLGGFLIGGASLKTDSFLQLLLK